MSSSSDGVFDSNDWLFFPASQPGGRPVFVVSDDLLQAVIDNATALHAPLRAREMGSLANDVQMSVDWNEAVSTVAELRGVVIDYGGSEALVVGLPEARFQALCDVRPSHRTLDTAWVATGPYVRQFGGFDPGI